MIVSALVILITLFYLLTGGTLFQPKVNLYMYVPDSTGLGPGAPVRVDGITVGKVEKVELSGLTDPQRIVKLTMRLERASLITIPADSVAQLTSETLIGDQYVDIASGRSVQTLQPNTFVTYRSQPDMMKSLDIQQFEARLKAVDGMLTDIEQGRSRVGQLVLGEQLYRGLHRRIAEIQTSFHEASSTTTAVGSAIYTDTLYRKIEQPVQALDQALARLQSGQGTGGRLLRDSATYDSIVAGIANVRRAVTNVRGSAFIATSTAYDQWSRSVQSLVGRVDDFNTGPLLTRADTYESLNGKARELAASMKDFRENPKKFLRLKLF